MIGMADSVHLGRWLRQFDEDDFQIRIVSSSPHRRIHPLIREKLGQQTLGNTVSMPLISRAFSLPMWVLDRLLGDLLRGLIIAFEIRRFKPSFIHVNELQNAGYATLRALKLLNFRNVPPLFTTNYGSELIWFSKFKSHKNKLIELLLASQAFSAECRRDYKLAKELGFTGIEMEQMPVAGGSRLSPLKIVRRKSIAIKGYHNKWGRALVVLSVMQKLERQLSGFRLEIFSCNRVVLRKVKELKRSSSLDIIAHPKGALGHHQMMELFSRSLLYIGFSMSDGISTSMVESMSNGAIPIQTATSCADEWIKHGETGFLLAPDDEEGLKAAIEAVISGDFNQDAARESNFKTIQNKYDADTLKQIAREQYMKMLMLSQ